MKPIVDEPGDAVLPERLAECVVEDWVDVGADLEAARVRAFSLWVQARREWRAANGVPLEALPAVSAPRFREETHGF